MRQSMIALLAVLLCLTSRGFARPEGALLPKRGQLENLYPEEVMKLPEDLTRHVDAVIGQFVDTFGSSIEQAGLTKEGEKETLKRLFYNGLFRLHGGGGGGSVEAEDEDAVDGGADGQEDDIMRETFEPVTVEQQMPWEDAFWG